MATVIRRFLIATLLVGTAATIIIFFQQPAPKTSGAMEALNMWGLQRSYPGDSFPSTGYVQQFESVHQKMAEHRGAIENESWQPLGPYNIGGRTLAIAFNPQNPNTVYAGSSSGGLWRSYTGGDGVEAWEQVMTGHPVLGVSSIAIAAEDSNTMYIGTGEVHNYQYTGMDGAIRITRGSYGIGVLKTTDGGSTWEKSLDWSYNQERGVWAVRINPLNPNSVWAGTTEGVYRSLDAGQTWTQMSNQLMITDMEINHVDTTVIFAASGNLDFPDTRGIYRSTDAGQTWEELTNGIVENFGGKAMISLAPSDPDIVYASIGNGYWSGAGTWLYRSADGGDSWTLQTTQDYSTWQGWFSHDIAVYPDDSDHLIVIGIKTHESFDGGEDLTEIATNGGAYFGRTPVGGPEGPDNYVHSDQHVVVLHPDDPQIIYIGSDGGVFRSLDGGDTWAGKNGGYRCTQFYPGFASSYTDSALSIGGMQDNWTAIYDGEEAWIRVIGGDGGWAAIDAEDAETIYGSWQYLNLLKSANGGDSWSSITPPDDGNSIFIAPFIVSVSDPNYIYAGRGHIYKSSNYGSSWTTMNSGGELDGNPVQTMAMSYTNPDVVYAATSPFYSVAGVYRTVNGGLAWQDISGDLPDRFPTDLAVDPQNDAVVYITMSGFGSPHLFRSDNFGSDWVAIDDDLPDVPGNAVIVDPLNSNHIYYGNDFGVYFSDDAGENWELFSDGLPDAVIAIDLSISLLDRSLRLATHGSGVYQRDLAQPAVDIAAENHLPEGFNLGQNYPNPFNPSTVISLELANASDVQLTVFDVNGQLVKRLIQNERKAAGGYEVSWDGRNEAGNRVATGMYFYQLQVNNSDGLVYTATKRMTLVK